MKNVLLLIASVALFSGYPAWATQQTWTGTSSTTWSVNGNWSTAAPTNDLVTDTALFNSTTYAHQPTVATATSVAGITIGDGTTATGALTITETGALSIGATGITMNANAGAATLSSTGGTLLGASQTWTNNSSNLLTDSGTISNIGNAAPFTLTIAGSGNTTLSGIISDGGVTGTTGIIVNTSGSSVTTLGAVANSFTGGLAIQNGIVKGAANAATFGAGPISLGNGAGGNATLQAASTQTYTNAINTVAGSTGTLLISNLGGAGSPTYSGLVTLGSGTTLTLSNSATAGLTLSGGITGTGNISITSSSANTVTTTIFGALINNVGNITVSTTSAATATISTTSINNNGTITNNGTSTGTTTISGALGGSVTNVIENSTTSALTLSGTNTNFAGLATVTAGTLKMGGTSALNANDTVVVNSGATFDIAANTTTIGGINDVSGSGGTVTNSSTAKVLTIGGSGTYSFAGALTATTPANLALTMNGTGTQTLSGTNTETGALIVSGGTLILSGSNQNATTTVSGGLLNITSTGSINSTTASVSSGTLLLGSNSALGTSAITLSGGILAASTTLSGVANAFADTGTATIGGTNNITLSGSFTNSGGNRTLTILNTGSTALTGGNVFLSELSTAGRTLTVNGAGNATIGDVIADFSGSGTAGSLTYSGTGDLTLTNANTYSGTTTVSNGTLTVANAAALGTSAVALSGGTLDLGTDTSVNAYNVTVSGNTTIASDKATAGTGGTTQTLGTLSIGTETLSVVAGPNVSGGAPVVAFGATTLLSTTGTTSIFNPTTANLALTTVTSLAAAGKTDTLDLDGTSVGNTVTGIIGNGATGAVGVTKSNTSTWTLSAANTYTGTTTVNGGTLATSLNASGNPFGTGATTINDGALNFAPSGTSGTIAYTDNGGAFSYGDATVSLNKGSNTTLTVTLGSGAGTRLTNGLLVVTTANTGDLGSGAGGENLLFGTVPTVTNGMVNATFVGLGVTTAGMGDFLTYGANGFTSASSGYTIHSTDFTTTSNEIADVTGNASITTTNTVRGLLVQSGDTATLLGTLNFVSNGGIILNGGNINGGTINIANNAPIDIYDFNAASTISSMITISTGGNGTPLVFGGNQTLTVSGAISLPNSNSTVTVTSGGLTLLGSVGVGSGLTVNGGTLNLDAPYLASANTLTVGSDATSALTESVANAITGSAALSVSGGTATLSQVNNYTGATGVNGSGTLDLTGAGAVNGSVVTSSNGGVLNVTTANAITGASSLIVGVVNQNAAVANITAAQNYTGATTVASAGTLNISGSGTLSASSVSVKGGTLNLQTTGAISQGTLTYVSGGLNETALDAISGTAGLTVEGVSSLVLTQGNNYSGNTIINNGSNQFSITGSNGSGIVGTVLDFSESNSAVNNIINNGISHASISTGSTLVMEGGTLNLVGKANTANSQEFNGLVINPGASFFLAIDGSGTGTMTANFNAITRNTGGTLIFANGPGGTGTVSNTGIETTTTLNTDYTSVGGSNTILGGWIVDGSGWATVNPVTGVISALTNYTTFNTIGSTIGLDIEAGNSSGHSTSVASINSLRFNTAGIGDITFNNNVVIASGGILVTSTNASADIIEGGAGTLTSGNGQDLITFVNAGSLAINANITNDGSTPIGLTKSGGSTLILGGANTFTGPLTINQGTVQLANASALNGSTGVAVAFNAYGVTGPTLDLNGNNATITNLSDDVTAGLNAGPGIENTNTTTASTLTINNTANDIFNGGIYLNYSGSPSVPVGGVLNLVKSGVGTLTLTASAETGNSGKTATENYNGTTTINGGKLLIASTGADLSNTSSIAVNSGGSIGSVNGVIFGYTGLNAMTSPATGVAFAGMTVAGGGAIDQTDGIAGEGLTVTAAPATTSLTFGDATSGKLANFDLDLGSSADSVSTGGTSKLSIITTGGSGLQVNLVGLGNLSGTTQTIINAAAGGFASGSSISTFVGNVGAGQAVTLGTTSGNFGGYTVALVGNATTLQLSETANATPAAAFFSGAQGNAWNLFTNGNANNTDWVTTDNGSTDTTQQPASTTNVNFGTAPLSGTPLANYLNNVLGANYTINSLTFDSTAASSAINISGNNTLTINAGTSGGNISGNGITDSATGGTQTISTNLVTLGASQTWTVTNAADTLAVSAGITDSANAFTLTKAGAGSLVLSSPNTYYGGTTVSAGQLYANSATGSSTGFGNVSVASGGTLGGTGTVAPLAANGIAVADGGNLAPGGVQPAVAPTARPNGSLSLNTVGITSGDTILAVKKNTGSNAGLTFAIGAGGAGPTNSATSVSQLLVTGNVANIMNFNIGGTSGTGVGATSTVISINDLVGPSLTFTQIPGGTSDLTEYVLIQGNNTTYEDNGLTLAAAGDLGNSTPLGQQILGGLSLLQPTGGNTFSQQFASARLFLDGDNIVLAVPEPSTWALLMLGGLGLLVFFQRRQRRQR